MPESIELDSLPGIDALHTPYPADLATYVLPAPSTSLDSAANAVRLDDPKHKMVVDGRPVFQHCDYAVLQQALLRRCAYLFARHCAPMWVRGIMSVSARLYSVAEGADGGSSRSQGEGLRVPGRSSPGRALSRPTELRREAQLSEALARRRPAIWGGVLSIKRRLVVAKVEQWRYAPTECSR